MSVTQVMIGGVVASAAQASTTILTYNYDISTTGCGPATDSGVITVLPTPVMQLYAGNPNQPSVCNNDPITDIDYIFNTSIQCYLQYFMGCNTYWYSTYFSFCSRWN